jgi:hypothetical protein
MQLRIGAELATTRFVAVCEADTLYPPEFFRFRPPRTDTYYYPRSGYIIWQGKARVYYRKQLRELTGIVARDHLLRILDDLQPRLQAVWREQDAGKDAMLRIDTVVREHGAVETMDVGPVVMMQTTRARHMQSPYSRGRERQSLPVWGSVDNVWNQYRCD